MRRRRAVAMPGLPPIAVGRMIDPKTGDAVIDPHQSARVRVSIDGVAARGAQGRILTGPAMDTRNTFDRPNTLVPAAYSGRADGGALVFDLPAKSVAVVAVER